MKSIDTIHSASVNALLSIAPYKMTDHEALSNIIETLAPGRNADEIAKALLDQFGTLQNVIEAPADTLRNYTTPATAEKLAALLPIFRIYINRAQANKEQIHNSQQLASFCKSLLMGKQDEEFWLVCVNSQCRVVGTAQISHGSISECAAYPRSVMRAALQYNAHSVFLTHNHPGGTCAPSQEDIQTTKQLQRALATIGVMVLDHCIVAGNSTYLMSQHGDLEFGARAL